MDKRNPDNLADAPGADSGGAPNRPDAAAGAKPSITAPANSIRPLHYGIDSLYVSQAGTADVAVLEELDTLKGYAQDTDEMVKSLAEYCLGKHRFQVLPYGRGAFGFVLKDNWLRIEVARSPSRLPLAYVQLGSQHLTSAGADAALASLGEMLPALGTPSRALAISRLDVCVDFVAPESLATFPREDWVWRGRKRATYEDGDRVTGINFSQAGDISARIYDKTLEIEQQSGKYYLHDIWREKGWDGESPVTRLEFQVKRNALPEELRGNARHALTHLPSLWRYLTEEWLRLAVPSATDSTRARWVTHPWWSVLQEVGLAGTDAPTLKRVSKTETPTDEWIYRNLNAALTSYMAKFRMSDYYHAKVRIFDSMEARFRIEGRNLEKYIRQKFAEKTWRYHTKDEEE